MAGVLDRVRRSPPDVSLAADERLDGLTCVVTGGNRGLGRAIAAGLATRGARLVLACRSGGEEAARALAQETGADVDSVVIDLASIASVERAAAELRERGVRADRLVLSAGVVPRASRRSSDGFDLMFQVNYLANAVLVDELLMNGVLPLSDGGPSPARIVVIGSESHRSAPEVDLATLGEPVDYGTRDVMRRYALSKLLLTAWAIDLAGRLTSGEGTPAVTVHVLGPGAVATDIAREAPAWVKPMLGAVMRLAFQSPAAAARPAIWLACAKRHDGVSGTYHHMGRAVAPSPAAVTHDFGTQLHAVTSELLAELR